VVRHAQAGGESQYFNTRNYDIETSDDGQNWVTVVQERGNIDAVTHSHLPAPKKARYLRLRTIDATQTAEQVSRIYEFEAYGAAPGTVTRVED
jgi:hypothetical protein